MRRAQEQRHHQAARRPFKSHRSRHSTEGQDVTAITFTIPGTPKAKQRPRFNGQTRHAYTPAETVSWERTVGIIARQHFSRPIDGPVHVEIIAIFAPAPSWSKKKRSEAMHRPHTQKPDLDNIAKGICDALNRIAYADDGQVASTSARKMWGPEAKTIVRVEPFLPVGVGA
jgi:Holliday junction resolvase RusA-like endonuclease